MAELLRIEIAYADPDRQLLRELLLPRGSTVADALQLSRIAEEIGADCIAANRIGIFSQPVDPGTRLRDGDRVEIYRELRADPKQSRRLRAQANRRKSGVG